MNPDGRPRTIDLLTALRTTGSAREFTTDTVDDATIHRILDTARFAPSGGNRQGWRVIVVRDPERRGRLRELYEPIEAEYIAALIDGRTAFAPGYVRPDEPVTGLSMGFAEGLGSHPVVLLVLAELSTLSVTDQFLDRTSIVGGASIYPFAYDIVLAARAEGLGGVMTTLLSAAEPEVATEFAIPPTHALAAMVVLGVPTTQVTRLRRNPVGSFTTIDSFDGPALPPPG